MKKTIIAIAAVAILQGCAGSPIALSNMDSEKLKQQDEKALCAAYGHMKDTTVKAELKRRGAIKDWARVDAGTIKIGDSEATLLCTRGIPTKVNTTVSASGTRKQWVYGIHGNWFAPVYYVYTTNGRISAWQN